MKHTPVLLQEAIEALQIVEGEKYIDATAGQGGHMMEILKHKVQVLAIDQDQDQINALKKTFSDENGLTLVIGNFADIESIAKQYKFENVSGILFDFGLSWRQLADSGKGLSYKKTEEILDMRLNDEVDRTARQIIADYTVEDLYEMFSRNAEEYHSQAIAEEIARARIRCEIATVGNLLNVINKTLQNCKMGHRHGTDVYARVFQALRIEVNDEFNAIRKGLDGSLKILKPEGRIVTIAFHSLEDRIVKQFVKNYKLRQANKGVVRGDQSFGYSRSAKMRVIIK